MLFKLSLTGIKSRWKDYLVLFSGLIMATAIFYMFEAIATNKSFTTSTTVGASAKFVFGFGSILLIIITLVYVSSANTFLLSMRQHDYGLFMMLGARSTVISRLISIETMIIGLISTILGLVLGIGLTQLLGGFLMRQLDIPAKGFEAFYGRALLWTVVIFAIIF